MDRALNSDAGKHFHFFLFKLFSFSFPHYYFIFSVVCCANGSQQVFLWMLNSQSLGPTGKIMCL